MSIAKITTQFFVIFAYLIYLSSVVVRNLPVNKLADNPPIIPVGVVSLSTLIILLVIELLFTARG